MQLLKFAILRETKMKSLFSRVSAGLFAGIAGLSLSVFGTEAMADDKKMVLKTPSAFATNLPITGSTSVYFADMLKEVSGGTLNIKMFEPGELMPAFDIHQAVSDGQVQAGYTCGAYLGGSLKEAIPYCTMPFGPEPHVFLGWLYEGNGTKLWEKIYSDGGYNVKVWPLAVYASEGAGWFTKRIEKTSDWEGTKIRIGGFAGPTLKKLGAIPTLIPFGEIFPGLEKGVIDAAEMGLPANDLTAGLHKVAKYYHMPSWHQPYTVLEIVLNKDVWNKMSKAQQAQWESSVRAANVWSMTHANAIQNAALKTLTEEKGVEIVKFSPETLADMRAAFNEVLDETMSADPEFKMVWDDLREFMADYKSWENTGMIGRNQSAFD